MTLASEILADSPYLYWRCNEAAGVTAVDSSGNARDGTIGGDVLLGEPRITDPVRDPGGGSFAFNRSGTDGQILHAATGWPTTNITAEFWLDPEGINSGLFSMASATYANNFLAFLSAGSNDMTFTVRDASTSWTNVPGLDTLARHHLVTTWRSSDGRAQLWIDGTLRRTSTVATGLSMETGGQLLFAQEQDTPGGGGLDPNQVLHGLASNLAVFHTVLSDARILAHYNEGRQDPEAAAPPSVADLAAPAVETVEVVVEVPIDPPTAPPAAATPDTTAPVISNFTPSPGTTLDPADEVEFDVTDNSGAFARNMIAVAFADGTQELAYDGQTFTALYLAGSTVAPTVVGQDAGYHYVLRRIGGWPGATITVRGFSVDSSGNTE